MGFCYVTSQVILWAYNPNIGYRRLPSLYLTANYHIQLIKEYFFLLILQVRKIFFSCSVTAFYFLIWMHRTMHLQQRECWFTPSFLTSASIFFSIIVILFIFGWGRMNIKPQQCITMETLGRFAKGKGAHNAFCNRGRLSLTLTIDYDMR